MDGTSRYFDYSARPRDQVQSRNDYPQKPLNNREDFSDLDQKNIILKSILKKAAPSLADQPTIYDDIKLRKIYYELKSSHLVTPNTTAGRASVHAEGWKNFQTNENDIPAPYRVRNPPHMVKEHPSEYMDLKTASYSVPMERTTPVYSNHAPDEIEEITNQIARVRQNYARICGVPVDIPIDPTEIPRDTTEAYYVNLIASLEKLKDDLVQSQLDIQRNLLTTSFDPPKSYPQKYPHPERHVNRTFYHHYPQTTPVSSFEYPQTNLREDIGPSNHRVRYPPRQPEVQPTSSHPFSTLQRGTQFTRPVQETRIYTQDEHIPQSYRPHEQRVPDLMQPGVIDLTDGPSNIVHTRPKYRYSEQPQPRRRNTHIDERSRIPRHNYHEYAQETTHSRPAPRHHEQQPQQQRVSSYPHSHHQIAAPQNQDPHYDINKILSKVDKNELISIVKRHIGVSSSTSVSTGSQRNQEMLQVDQYEEQISTYRQSNSSSSGPPTLSPVSSISDQRRSIGTTTSTGANGNRSRLSIQTLPAPTSSTEGQASRKRPLEAATSSVPAKRPRSKAANASASGVPSSRANQHQIFRQDDFNHHVNHDTTPASVLTESNENDSPRTVLEPIEKTTPVYVLPTGFCENVLVQIDGSRQLMVSTLQEQEKQVKELVSTYNLVKELASLRKENIELRTEKIHLEHENQRIQHTLTETTVPSLEAILSQSNSTDELQVELCNEIKRLQKELTVAQLFREEAESRLDDMQLAMAQTSSVDFDAASNLLNDLQSAYKASIENISTVMTSYENAIQDIYSYVAEKFPSAIHDYEGRGASHDQAAGLEHDTPVIDHQSGSSH